MHCDLNVYGGSLIIISYHCEGGGRLLLSSSRFVCSLANVCSPENSRRYNSLSIHMDTYHESQLVLGSGSSRFICSGVSSSSGENNTNNLDLHLCQDFAFKTN